MQQVTPQTYRGTQYRLPDGTFIEFSDDPTERRTQLEDVVRRFPEQYGGALSPQQYTTEEWDQAQEPGPVPEIGMLDERRINAAVRSGLYGIADIPFNMASAVASATSPHTDTRAEQSLRRAEQLYLTPEDDEAAALYTSQLARGLGMAGGLYGIAMIPYVGVPLAIAGGLGFGISEASRMLKDYERENSTDVPWHKETLAHAAGAVIGLTEMFLPARISMLRKVRPPTTKLQRFGQALGGATQEGLQEGLAQVGQSAVARGLYDENALDNLGYAAAEEAKGGAGVGLITSVLAGVRLRGVDGAGTPDGLSSAADEQVARAREDLRVLQEGQTALTSSNVRELAQEEGVDEAEAQDVVKIFTESELGGVAAGLENSLRNASNIFAMQGFVERVSAQAQFVDGIYSQRIQELQAAIQESGDPDGSFRNEISSLEKKRRFAQRYASSRADAVQGHLSRLMENRTPEEVEALNIRMQAAKNVDNLEFQQVLQNVNKETINAYAMAGSAAVFADAQHSLGLETGQGPQGKVSDRNSFGASLVGALMPDENFIDAPRLKRINEGIDALEGLDNTLLDEARQESVTEETSLEFLKKYGSARRQSVASLKALELQRETVYIEGLKGYLDTLFEDGSRTDSGFNEAGRAAIKRAAEQTGMSAAGYAQWLGRLKARIDEQADGVQRRRDELDDIIANPDDAADRLGQYRQAFPETEKIFSPLDVARFSAISKKGKVGKRMDAALLVSATTKLSSVLADAKQAFLAPGPRTSNKRLADVIEKTFEKLKNKPNRGPTLKDIEAIFEVKNMRLRDESVSVGDVGIGKDSPAFKKLLADLTGATSWSNASPAQKWKFYSDIAGMAPNTGYMRGRQLFGSGLPDTYEQAYLPDLHEGYDPIQRREDDYTPEYQAVMSQIGKRLNPLGDGTFAAASIHKVKDVIDSAVKGGLDKARVEEAVTKLIERGMLDYDSSVGELSIGTEAPNKPTSSAFPDIADPEQMTEEDFRTRETESLKSQINVEKAKETFKDMSSVIEYLRDIHNKRYPQNQLGTEEFVENYAEDLSRLAAYDAMSSAAKNSLTDIFVDELRSSAISATMQSVDPSVKKNIREQLRKRLQEDGAIPIDQSSPLDVAEKQHVARVKKAVSTIRSVFQEELTRRNVSDQIQLELVAELDDIALIAQDVDRITNPSLLDQSIVYNSATGRIIINLSRLDLLSSDAIAAAQIAGRDISVQTLVNKYLPESQLQTVINYAKNTLVPKGINVGNLESPTWLELVEAEHKGLRLGPKAIERLAAARVLSELERGDNLLGDPKSLRTPSRLARDITRSLSGAFIKEPDLLDVFRVFERVTSGRTRYEGERPDVERANLEDSVYLRFADGEQMRQLEQLYTTLNNIDNTPENQSRRENVQAQIDSVMQDVAETRSRVMEGLPVDRTLDQALVDLKTVDAAIEDTPSSGVSPIRRPSSSSTLTNDLDGKVNRGTAEELAKMIDGKEPYRMPDTLRSFLANKDRIDAAAKELVRRAERSGVVPKEKDIPVLQYLEGLNRAEADLTQMVDDLDQVKGIGWILNKHAPVEVFDSFLAGLAEAGPMMERDRASSMGFIAAQLDNARGFTRGLYELGPVVFVGSSIEDGVFGNEAVYDEKLARWEQENSNRVRANNGEGTGGLAEGFKVLAELIAGDGDQKLAAMYGIAKRISASESEVRLLQAELDGLKATLPEPLLRQKKAELRTAKSNLEALYTVQLTNKKGKIVEAEFTEELVKESIETVENGNNDHIVEFWERWSAFNRANLRTALDAGLLSETGYNKLLEMDYFPFFSNSRAVSEAQTGDGLLESIQNPRTISDMTVLDRNMEGGSQVNYTNLLDNLSRNTQNLIYHSLQNSLAARTGRDLVALGLADGVGGMPSKDKMGTNQYLVWRENGERKVVKLTDVDADIDLTPIVKAVMTARFNPVRDMQRLFGDGRAGELISGAVYGSTGVMRESITKLPDYSARNLFRDALSASITLGDPTIFVKAVRNAFDPTTLPKAWSMGIATPIDMVTSDPDAYNSPDATRGRKTIEDLGLTGKSVINPVKAIKLLWNAFGRFTDQAESATRVAVAERAMANGYSRAAGVEQALEVLPYGRRGTQRELSMFLSTITFISGRMQGMDVFWRSMSPFLPKSVRKKWPLAGPDSIKTPGLQFADKTKEEYENLSHFQRKKSAYFFGLASLTGINLMIEVIHRLTDEDDEYESIDKRIRRENYLIPWSRSNWIRLPGPFEIGLITKTIPTTIIEAVLEEDYRAGEATADVVASIDRALSLGAPQIVAPIIDVMRNKDSFLKNEIVSSRREQDQPRFQYDRGTTDFARIIARMLEPTGAFPLVGKLGSPLVLEYLLTQYLGSTAVYSMTITDAMIRSDMLPFRDLLEEQGFDIRSAVGSRSDFNLLGEEKLESLFTGDGSHNLPLLSSFLTDPRSRRSVMEEFYQLHENINRVTRGVAQRRNEASGLDEEVDRILVNDEAGKQLQVYRSEINELRRLIDLTNANERSMLNRTDISDRLKRERYNEFQQVKAGYALQAAEAILAYKENQSFWQQLTN